MPYYSNNWEWFFSGIKSWFKHATERERKKMLILLKRFKVEMDTEED